MPTKQQYARFAIDFLHLKAGSESSFFKKWGISEFPNWQKRQDEFDIIWANPAKRQKFMYEKWLKGPDVFRGRTKRGSELGLRFEYLPVFLAACVVSAGDLVGNCFSCSKPFIKKRADQLYCSQDCAAPAKKRAKLKYWDRTGRKKRDEARRKEK